MTLSRTYAALRWKLERSFFSPPLHLKFSSFALFLFLFLFAVARGQAPQVLQTSAELVKVDVSVADKHGDFVESLTQSDFRILDNGVERPITFFTPVDAPAQVLVLIETGPAVYLIHGDHLAAAYALLDGLEPRDQVALAAYDNAPRRILPFTSNKSLLLAALGGIQYNIGMGELNFYGSLAKILDWLDPVPGKRAIVLLTTGLDSSQPSHWDALVEKARRDDVVIFPVALGGSLRSTAPVKGKGKKAQPNGPNSDTHAVTSGNPVSFARADHDLRALASITGGRAYFPDSRQDFVAIYRQIAAMLRHQYVLGFAPAHDGQLHSLSVELVSSKALGRATKSRNKGAEYQIFSRSGYLAPAP
ncbi:MAG TPA: VWA domain-containing protein [Candidatus Acidoferrales bacterium]|nr:VWA domain-containing protein [Candidatus Acidoferrales bacterium]